MRVTKEAIEAACVAYWPNHWERFRENAKLAGRNQMRAVLEAALSSLPIAGEGKVKALEWTQGDEDPGYHFAQSPIGNYIITEFPVVGDDQLTVRLLGTSQYGVWFGAVDEAKAAANDDYTKRVFACVISSPGKDGGQEGEAVRQCTCHSDDNPPKPCAQQFALSACQAVASGTKHEATDEMVAAYKTAFRDVFDLWLNDQLNISDKEISSRATKAGLNAVLVSISTAAQPASGALINARAALAEAKGSGQ